MSRTKQQRKQKTKQREERELRHKQKQHDLFNSALRKIGVRDLFMQIDAPFRALLRKNMFGDPIVTLGPTMADCPEADELRRRCLAIVRAPTRCPGQTVTPAEWFSVVQPLFISLHFVTSNTKRYDKLATLAYWPSVMSLTEELRRIKEELQAKIFGWMCVDFLHELLYRSRLDDKILWFQAGHAVSPKLKRMSPQYTLHKAEPEWTTIEVDGISRPAFRCTLVNSPLGPTELSFPRSELGVQFGPDEFPVYMQRHALEQLLRRVEGATGISMTYSLVEPRLFNVEHGRFLVEYRIFEKRLGYFVGEVIGDKVLLKTFLFLTMQGTPEAELLYKNLKLTRSDISYTHLDNLDFFGDPKLAEDKQLRRILDKCGCGHLIDLNFTEDVDHAYEGHAEALRAYLNDSDAAIARSGMQFGELAG